MARIEYVKRRLENWSRWSQARADGALGFSSSSPLTRIGMPRSMSFTSVATDQDAECMETERAVLSMRSTHIDLWKTMTLYYIKCYDIARCASVERVAESTLKARLCRADVVLDAWFIAQKEVQEKQARNKSA